MSKNILAAIARIDADVALIRQELESGVSLPTPSAGEIKLKSSYSKSAAIAEKARIDEAYERGEITYDKRRGMKMVVTKATKGWTPDKRPTPPSGHGRGGHGASVAN